MEVTMSHRNFFILLFLALAVIVLFGAGCVCQPGGRITVCIGYRSAQGVATNIINQVEGGAALTSKVTP